MKIGTRALRFWTKFDRDWGWNLARLLAYTLLQALFAVAGMQIVILALVLRFTSARAQNVAVARIAHLLPDRVETGAFEVFARSLQSAPGWLLALALPIAIWYGSRLFAVLESALCVVFRRPRRQFLPQNGMAMLMLPLFTLLLPVIVLSATAVPRIGVSPQFVITIVDPDALASEPWIPWLALLAGLVANFILVQVAYALLTPGGVPWRAAWPGALIAAALAQGYLLLFPLYVRYVLRPNHFGAAVGFALVSLVFLYAYGVFIMIGAEVAALRAGYGPSAGDVTETMARAETAAWSAPRRDMLPRIERRSRGATRLSTAHDDTQPASVVVAPLLLSEQD
ncbi:MAG TPA: YhjD/YihY/BrkB family envelope integrity protein [Ktedonobacterales bacterium]